MAQRTRTNSDCFDNPSIKGLFACVCGSVSHRDWAYAAYQGVNQGGLKHPLATGHRRHPAPQWRSFQALPQPEPSPGPSQSCSCHDFHEYMDTAHRTGHTGDTGTSSMSAQNIACKHANVVASIHYRADPQNIAGMCHAPATRWRSLPVVCSSSLATSPSRSRTPRRSCVCVCARERERERERER